MQHMYSKPNPAKACSFSRLCLILTAQAALKDALEDMGADRSMS